MVDAKDSEPELSGDARDDCETAVETVVWDVVESASVCSFRLKFRLFCLFGCCTFTLSSVLLDSIHLFRYFTRIVGLLWWTRLVCQFDMYTYII